MRTQSSGRRLATCLIGALGAVVLLAARPVSAHHGWGGYDTSKSFTVTGAILKSTYENPHCEIEM